MFLVLLLSGIVLTGFGFGFVICCLGVGFVFAFVILVWLADLVFLV